MPGKRPEGREGAGVGMDEDEIWSTIHAQRGALADLLEGLSPAQWQADTLCTGWTVLDVAAHVISSPQATPAAVLRAMVRARGNFNRCIFEEAKRWSNRPTREIVADYRRLDGSRRHPLGTTRIEPLLDVLVHTQDIARPLQLRHPMPPQASAIAADYVWRRPFPFHAKRRLSEFRFLATDADWSAGSGMTIEGAAGAVLMVLTGRTITLDELTGDGVGWLTEYAHHKG